MASRPILPQHPVITNGDMSGSITSEVTVITNISMISYDISWTGTSPVGAITVEVSNTYTKNAAGGVKVAGDWQTLPLSSSTNISGNSGNGFIDIDILAAYAVRLKYTRQSGTGTLNVTINGKVA